MNGRILSWDGTVMHTWHYDSLTDEATIAMATDVTPLLERNKRMQINTDGYTKSRSMRHVASIDPAVYQWWLQEAFGPYWMQRPTKEKLEVLKRRVNDPDFRDFRTVTVKI